MPSRCTKLVLALALAGLTLSAAPADAQQDVEKQVLRMNKKAMEDYDSLEFESARQTLAGAIAKLREAGLDDTKAAAITYVNLGIVDIAGFKDRNRGVKDFENALKVSPQIKLDPERATPDLQEAFDEAAKNAAASGNKKPPPTEDHGGEKPPTDNQLPEAKGLEHNPVDEAKAGQPITIKARLSPEIVPQRMFVFYRAAGQEDFVSVPMEEGEAGSWSGEIPGEAVQGKTLHYYIEARDAKSRPLVASGSAASPYIISIVGGGEGNAGEDRDNPLRGQGHGEEKPAGADRGWGRLYLDVMVGSGAGIIPAGNHTEVAYQWQPDMGANNPAGCMPQAGGGCYIQQPVGSAGFAPSLFHIAAELGVRVTQHISIGALARIQVVTGANADSSAENVTGSGTVKASGAFAALLRFKYWFLDGKFHPYVHLDAGYGYIRQSLDISSAENDDHPLADVTTANYNNTPGQSIPAGSMVNEVCRNHHNDCVDTVAMGYVLFGGGAGIWYDVAKFRNGGFGLLGELNILIGVGDQTGVNFDLQLGVGVHFL